MASNYRRGQHKLIVEETVKRRNVNTANNNKKWVRQVKYCREYLRRKVKYRKQQQKEDKTGYVLQGIVEKKGKIS